VRRFLISFLAVFLTAATLIVGTIFGVGWFLAPQDPLVKSDAVVAISGGETVSRAREAIRLYREGWAPKIVFSGAAFDPRGPSNALAMKRLAVGNGVPADDILIEETSTNTAENARDVTEIARQHDFRSLILVTSPYHQRRASITFRRALGPEVKIINHSTTDQNWRRARWWNNDYSYQLTLDELKKTIYVVWSDRTGSN
jgi:uncharacterized SAM-binding protein YcdF (DUF218 family)